MPRLKSEKIFASVDELLAALAPFTAKQIAAAIHAAALWTPQQKERLQEQELRRRAAELGLEID